VLGANLRYVEMLVEQSLLHPTTVVGGSMQRFATNREAHQSGICWEQGGQLLHAQLLLT
jgi:hypothetical protein